MPLPPIPPKFVMTVLRGAPIPITPAPGDEMGPVAYGGYMVGGRMDPRSDPGESNGLWSAIIGIPMGGKYPGLGGAMCP